ncbi:MULTISPECIES: FadR/GntR family transcriptional regulator [Sphingobacterium]|jgi:GntR family transcriptional repressor for pyruvate dehydrogenase complex|uniref:FadR/GntR family transcriptional regulator n=1 Tax=Sphingobacterium TaxID=28453 RepID=UPI00097F3FE8|nr:MULTISPECIES: FadR/GntR family transcriptional regulator [Sphingobacterium]SJN32947.1 Transcriptional regulator, GntR family [Sphingobacterium faecium PCAi_F2.5]HCU44362.1 FadR family transcriptional regulator [Sphingobacterium sp.]UPZ37537.1 FadR family transcriptional regulator [Sphingobacterium sp. PCS056]UXD69028.1 FadR family transcriptional regulator [Sphingobacterium faecium]WGQ16758.1 FadR/GntR family transcriptional regulator [Sphingobacterium faecium]
MLEKFENVDTSSLVDKVENHIIDLIRARNIQIGESLPKELELSESFGVSRTVIREALLRLRMVGLIESRKHRGAVLTNPKLLSPLKKIFHPAMLDDDTLKDIFEMRLALEVGMAELIFDRTSEEDIAELEAIVRVESINSDTRSFKIEEEVAFHGKLYKISGNKMLMDFQELLLPIFQYVHDSGLLNSDNASKEFISHKDLIKLLKNGDVTSFKEGMRKHLDNHYYRLLKH